MGIDHHLTLMIINNMNLFISVISANRKLGKAFTRNNSEIKKIESELKEQMLRKFEVEDFEIWFVDKPQDYLKIMKSNKKLIEIHSGVDQSLSFQPSDDEVFINFIRSVISKLDDGFFVKKK